MGFSYGAWRITSTATSLCVIVFSSLICSFSCMLKASRSLVTEIGSSLCGQSRSSGLLCPSRLWCHDMNTCSLVLIKYSSSPLLPGQKKNTSRVRSLQARWRSFPCSFVRQLTCIFPSTPVVSILLATFTLFPQMSYWGFWAPITPAITGPWFIPEKQKQITWL